MITMSLVYWIDADDRRHVERYVRSEAERRYEALLADENVTLAVITDIVKEWRG